MSLRLPRTLGIRGTPRRQRPGSPAGLPADLSAAVIEHLPDGIAVCDARGLIVAMNRRARASADGLAPPEIPPGLTQEGWAAQFGLYKRGAAQLLPTDELPLVRALRGETVRDMVLETRPPGGGRAVLNVSAGPVLDAGGDIQGAAVVIQDVTERVEIEDRLWLQSGIVAHIDAGVALVRAADGEIIYANERLEQQVGYGPGELVGRLISEINAPTDGSPEERARELLGALGQDGGWTGEVHAVRKDGTRFWCDASVSRFEHPSHGSVWVTAFTEIGGRKAAEDTLQRAEERYRTVFEQSPAGIVLIGSDMQLLDFNDAFGDILEYPRGDLVGVSLAAIVHPDEREAHTALLGRAFAGELAMFRDERRYVTRSGRVAHVELVGSVAHAADGHPLYAITVVQLVGQG